uniref:Caspase family p20 domain-containing protein n=1 Tax=Anabas testudineus TaxID=64144 RepID=A0A3Q1IPQ9_ANATE
SRLFDSALAFSDAALLGNIYPVSETSKANRVALLIANKYFYDTSTRRAAEKDEKSMEQLLQYLGYEVVKYNDLNGQEIDEALLNFSKHPKLTMTDSVFVVIMSPGDGLWRQSAVVGGVRNKPSDAVLDVEKVHERLYTKNCPALMNKPKIIIIQACSEGDSQGKTIITESTENNIYCFCLTDIGQYKSSFIQCIVRVFNSCVCEDHIEELFTKVSFSRGKFNSWRLPIQRCTLSKHFYLFPEDFSQKGE